MSSFVAREENTFRNGIEEVYKIAYEHLLLAESHFEELLKDMLMHIVNSEYKDEGIKPCDVIGVIYGGKLYFVKAISHNDTLFRPTHDSILDYYHVVVEGSGLFQSMTIQNVINESPRNTMKLCRALAAHIHAQENWAD